MSLRAPFVDAAKSIDPVNGNIFTSYYPYGAVIALALDLSLREKYHSSLDAYMQHMWKRNGAQQDYAPAKPYSPDDLQAGLAELTGDPAFAKSFFDASIRGGALPDFAPLLAPAGLVLRPAHPDQGWIGASAVSAGDGGAVTLDHIPAPDSPLYKAGVDRGDTMVSLGNATIATAGDWTAAVTALKPGEQVALVYRNRGGEHRATLTAVADPALEIVRTEAAGGTLTAAEQAFRDAWLGKAS
jgi:predicted metalloprotease with PDZ domain